MSSFEDISIVDLDLKKTTWSRVHSSMRTLYLRLSREPDLEWIRQFNTERESRIVPTRHGMWIEEGYIIFDCMLQNVERYHLPDFQQSIDYANVRCRERVAERRDERAQRRAEITEEHDALASLRAKIRRDDDDATQTLALDSEKSTLDSVVELPAADVIDETGEEIQAAPAAAVEPPAMSQTKTDAVEPASLREREAANDGDDFDVRRNEWRTRFRQALMSRKESDDADPK